MHAIISALFNPAFACPCNSCIFTIICLGIGPLLLKFCETKKTGPYKFQCIVTINNNTALKRKKNILLILLTLFPSDRAMRLASSAWR